MTTPSPISSQASITDVLSTLKNLVIAVNTLAQNYLNVQGALNAAAITAPTIIKSSAGRIARVSVVVAGSATGTVYDGVQTSDTSKPLYVIPMAVGVYEVNLPASFGINVTPGTGQTVTVSYS